MSFFMSAIPELGLISRPPLSKHTPLPTSARRGSPDRAAPRRPANLRKARRLGARAADRVNGGKVGGEQLLAHPFAIARLMALGHGAHGGGEFRGTQVARRRVDPIARPGERLDGERDVRAIRIFRRLERREALGLGGR
jgi:hypothetical protein